jgi:hypothetical protein
MSRPLAVNLSACVLLLVQYLLEMAVNVNYGHAFSSLIMAALWALALTCYAIGAMLALRRP